MTCILACRVLEEGGDIPGDVLISLDADDFLEAIGDADLQNVS